LPVRREVARSVGGTGTSHQFEDHAGADFETSAVVGRCNCATLSQHVVCSTDARREIAKSAAHAKRLFEAVPVLIFSSNGETPMTKLWLIGAAALAITSALAAPASAQEVITNPGRCAQYYPNANCQNLGPNNPYTGSYQRHSAAYRDDRGGFWPGDVAAGVVGGAVATADAAVDTAGAIATSPFRGRDAYAYDNSGYNNGYNAGYNGPGWNGQSYAERNGFVCIPGTWFKGEDGRRHICQ
jgi:hypothetical protein